MPDSTVRKPRPKWYNLSPVNLPAPAFLSIFHRVSGLLMFFGLIWLLYLLDMSLKSEADFQHFKNYTAHAVTKIVLLLMIWAFFHHLCAGIRCLFLDIEKGIDLATARMTSFVSFGISIAATVVVGAMLW